MTKNNRLPEQWSLRYLKNHPKIDQVLKKLDSLDKHRVEPWDKWIPEHQSNGIYLNFSCGIFFGATAKYPEISISDFISMTEEPEEWKPKRGELILVRDYDDDTWKERVFVAFNLDGSRYKYRAVSQDAFNRGETDICIRWIQCKPIEQPKPFEPTIGKVCYMKAEEDERNMVYLGPLGDKFMGCDVNEYADLLDGYEAAFQLFDSVSPVKKVVNTTPEVILKALGSDPGSDLEIDGYIKEKDAKDIITVTDQKIYDMVLEKDGVRFSLLIEKP